MESKGRPGLGEMREESALNMFRQMDLKGKSKDDTQLKTVHQNTIATLRSYDEMGGTVKKFSCKYSMLIGYQQAFPRANSSQPVVWMVEWSYGPHEMRVYIDPQLCSCHLDLEVIMSTDKSTKGNEDEEVA